MRKLVLLSIAVFTISLVVVSCEKEMNADEINLSLTDKDKVQNPKDKGN